MLYNNKTLQSTRSINNTVVLRLDQDVKGGGGPVDPGTNHTHANKALLDSLTLDGNLRLKVNSELVFTPLLDEEW